MKKCNKVIACALAAALVTTAMPESALASSKPVTLKQKSIALKITEKNGKLTYGKAKITLKKAKGVKVKSAKYQVKNKKIVKVSKKGVVTAKKKGQTKITVTVKYTQKKKTATRKMTLTVKVKKQTATAASAAPQSPSAPADTPAATGTADASSKAGATATPGENGTATPDSSKVADIRMIRKDYITYVGGNTALNPKVLPETAENQEVEYVSADTDIATINSFGLIYGVKEGTTTITIRATDGSNVEASVNIKVVTDPEVAEYVDDYYDAVNLQIIQDAIEELGGEETYWSILDDAQNIVLEREEAIIQDAVEHADDNEKGSVKDQIAALYQTISDTDARETAGIGGLAEYVAEIDGADTVEELLEVEAKLDQKGIIGIFNTTLGTTQEDTKTNKLYFDLTDYALFEYAYDIDDSFEEVDDPEYVDPKAAFQTYVDSLMEIAGEEDATVRNERFELLEDILKKFAVNFDALFDIPEDITEEEMQQYLDEMNVSMNVEYTPEELQNLMENCNLLSYLEQAGFDTSQNVVVGLPAQLKQIDECLTESNLDALKEYAKYELLSQYGTYFTEEIYHNFAAVYEAESGIAYTSYDDFAMSETESICEWEISSIYTDTYESEEKKQDISDMVDRIQEEYSKEIANCSWMSETTKESAQKKLAAMGKNVLYPDDYSKYLYNNDWALFEEGGSLLGNMMLINEEQAKKERDGVGVRISKNDWYDSPLTFNAFYYLDVNAIYICSAFVGDVVYDPERSDASNYGALGMVIGHEISHAFDANGAMYDENGNINNWWVDEDAEYYAGIQQQLVDYYDTFYLMNQEGEPLFQDGLWTLSENIADLAGMSCIVALVGDDKESRKELFTSYANVWAEMGTLNEENLLAILFDPHSVSKVRVNAIVSMLDEFYETYDVKEGDAMYVAPEDRIHIWR